MTDLIRSMLSGLSMVQLTELSGLIESEKLVRLHALTADEIAMVQARNPIGAIKSVRSRTGLPLRDSKDFVERACVALEGIIP